MNQAAEELKVSSTFLRKLINRGLLPAKLVVTYAPVCINRSDLLLAELQRRESKRLEPARDCHALPETKLKCAYHERASKTSQCVTEFVNPVINVQRWAPTQSEARNCSI